MRYWLLWVCVYTVISFKGIFRQNPGAKLTRKIRSMNTGRWIIRRPIEVYTATYEQVLSVCNEGFEQIHVHVSFQLIGLIKGEIFTVIYLLNGFPIIHRPICIIIARSTSPIYWLWRHWDRIVLSDVSFLFTLYTCCLCFRDLLADILGKYNIPCLSQARSALQPGQGITWTLYWINLNVFGKNFICLCQIFNVQVCRQVSQNSSIFTEKSKAETVSRSSNVAVKKVKPRLWYKYM